jgi:hypothetical protein
MFNPDILKQVFDHSQNINELLSGSVIILEGARRPEAYVCEPENNRNCGGQLPIGHENARWVYYESSGYVADAVDSGGAGLTFRLNNPTPLLITSVNNNNSAPFAISPEHSPNKYISYHTCGGGCSTYPMRMVLNKNGQSLGDITTHFKFTNYELSGGYGHRFGQFHIESSGSHHGYKAANVGLNYGSINMSNNLTRTQAFFRFGILKPGPILEEKYAKVLMESDFWGADLECCKQNYTNGGFDYDTGKKYCDKYGFKASHNNRKCDNIIDNYCKLNSAVDLCACSRYSDIISSLPNKTVKQQQIKSSPQCLVTACAMNPNAYEYSKQTDDSGARDCPHITICTQDMTGISEGIVTQNVQVQECGNEGDDTTDPSKEKPSTPKPWKDPLNPGGGNINNDNNPYLNPVKEPPNQGSIIIDNLLLIFLIILPIFVIEMIKIPRIMYLPVYVAVAMLVFLKIIKVYDSQGNVLN